MSKSMEIIDDSVARDILKHKYDDLLKKLTPEYYDRILNWNENKSRFESDEFSYNVRGKSIRVITKNSTLSHTPVSKIATPKYRDWGDILKWIMQENFPGEFPYTAGVYPFKRTGEDPTRCLPERNSREDKQKVSLYHVGCLQKD
ncbi:MAG: hypothetical protein R2771_03335 [Saprospiraceae bacterium]